MIPFVSIMPASRVYTLHPLKRWTRLERERFRNEFFTWAYPRWDKVLSVRLCTDKITWLRYVDSLHLT